MRRTPPPVSSGFSGMAEDPSNGPMTTRKWIAVMGTMLGAFMAVLDIQITNSSLRDISGGIAATPDEGSWISTGYLIGEIITIPLTAWLSRVFTLRWYLLANVVLFLIFSALCGISRSLGEMIVFRAGQGFTGGVFIPMALTVIVTTMPQEAASRRAGAVWDHRHARPRHRARLGGWLTDRFGWEWNFYVNFFPGVAHVRHGLFAIDPAAAEVSCSRDGDWWGIGCMAIGLGSLIAMLEEGQRKDWFGSDFIRHLRLSSPPSLSRRSSSSSSARREPFVNLRLLANRNLAISSRRRLRLGLGLYGSVYIIPLYLGEVQGYSPLQIGETLIWVGLPQLLIFPVAAAAHEKGGCACCWSALAALVFAVSCFMNTYMGSTTRRISSSSRTSCAPSASHSPSSRDRSGHRDARARRMPAKARPSLISSATSAAPSASRCSPR